MKNKVLIATIIFLLSIWSSAAWADNNNFNVNDDMQMDLRYDWIVNATINDSNYLAYPGSTLKPPNAINRHLQA